MANKHTRFGWNPDAIAPPHRDVYWRESEARSAYFAKSLAFWGSVALCLAMVWSFFG